eukprot:359397-Chlamydomonas_euryale.AAC.3
MVPEAIANLKKNLSSCTPTQLDIECQPVPTRPHTSTLTHPHPCPGSQEGPHLGNLPRSKANHQVLSTPGRRCLRACQEEARARTHACMRARKCMHPCTGPKTGGACSCRRPKQAALPCGCRSAAVV